MSLTNKQIYDLNNMNVAAQNVQLGTFLNSLSTQPIDKPLFYVVDRWDNPPTVQEIMLKLYQETPEIPILIENASVYVCSSVIVVSDGIDGGDPVPVGVLFVSHNTMSNNAISSVIANEASMSSYDRWISYTNMGGFTDGVYDYNHQYNPSDDEWNDAFVQLATVKDNAPFFTVAYENRSTKLNPTLQEMISRYIGGTSPILTGTHTYHNNVILSKNIASVTPVWSGNEIIGLTWTDVYYTNSGYYIQTYTLENETLTTAVYDSTQDTWTTTSPALLATDIK